MSIDTSDKKLHATYHATGHPALWGGEGHNYLGDDYIYLGNASMLDLPEAVKSVVAMYDRNYSEALKQAPDEETKRAVYSRFIYTFETFSALPHSSTDKDYPWLPPTNLSRYFQRHPNGTCSTDFPSYYRYLSDSQTAVGTFFRNGLPIALPEAERKKHTHIVGKTGSGKSEFLKLLIHYDIMVRKTKSAVVVLDPHGDLIDDLLEKSWWGNTPIKKRPKARNGEAPQAIEYPHGSEAWNNLVYVNPTLFTPSAYPSINPFDIGDNQDEAEIELAAGAIQGVFAELIGSHFTLQMSTLLTPCISTLLRKGGATIRDLQVFMNDDKNEYWVSVGKQSPNPDHARFFREMFNGDNYSTTKNSLYTRIQSLLNLRTFATFIASQTTINLKTHLDRGDTVFFNLSMGSIGEEAAEAIGRFVVAHIESIMRQRAKSDIRTPCHFYIDECQRFVSKKIEKALTELRKYGMHMTLANQFIGQDMDSQFKNALSSSTNVKFVGMNGAASLAASSRDIGVEVEQLQTLKVGEFYAKIGNLPAVKISVPQSQRKGIETIGASLRFKLINNQHQYYSGITEEKQNSFSFSGKSNSKNSEKIPDAAPLAPKMKR